jgi:hypothetical protein
MYVYPAPCPGVFLRRQGVQFSADMIPIRSSGTWCGVGKKKYSSFYLIMNMSIAIDIVI